MSEFEAGSAYLERMGLDCVELLRQLPGFVMITSGPDHHVEFANAGLSRLTRYREIVGRKLADALPELAEQGFIELRDRVYRSGEPHRETARPFQLQNAPDGALEDGFIDFVYQPLKDPDGAVTGIVFAGYDVTEHKQAEDRVRAMQFELMQVFRGSVLGAMAMILAHELNQPLAAISNYASAARRLVGSAREGDRDQALAALDHVEAASRRAAEIIRLVREMMGKGRPVGGQVDLGAAVRQAAALALIDAPRRGIAVDLDVEPRLVVGGDQVQIQQVLLNLFRNAVEALEGVERRTLEIVGRRAGAEAELRVADSGSGLAEEVRDRLFDPFVTTKESGLGVGLAICRALVERHGGRIWAEPRPGGGTMFCLRLPLAEG